MRLALPDLPDPESLIQRLFTIAEILARAPTHDQNVHFHDETGVKNRDALEIGYSECSDPL
jgi:hypothetical protein